MPVNATFTADFSSFLKAIDQAEVALVDFGKGASSVEKSLNRMVDNFSGRKLIQEATLLTKAIEDVGGVGTLTAKELAQVSAKASDAADKMRALGIEVPKGLQDLADATKNVEAGVSGMSGAMASFVGNLGAMALQQATRMAIDFGKAAFEAADRLVTLSARTGISIEALQTFQAVGDDTSVSLDTMANAVNTLQERLGKGDKGATAALEALHVNLADFLKLDPAQQFLQLAKAIKELKDPIEFARVASDLFGKNWKELAPALKQGFDEAALASQGMGTTTARALDEFGDKVGATTRWFKGQWAEAMADIVTLTLSATRAAADAFDKMITTAAAAAPKLNLAAALVPPGLPADLDLIMRKFEEEAKIINDQLTPAAIAFRAALADLSLVGTGWVAVLDTIDGSVVQAIKYYLEAGVSQKTLADAYGLTAQQIAAVAAARQNELAGLALENTLKARRLELQQIETDKTNAAVVARLAATQANEDFLKTELALAQAQDAANAAAGKAPAALAPVATALDATTKAANAAIEAFGRFSGMSFPTEGTVPQFVPGGGGGGQWSNPYGAGALGGGGPLHVQTRAAGGPVTGGQPYLVGEQGPELFVPGQSGSIAPGGVSVVNTFNIVDTEANIARRVSDRITQSILQGRKMAGL